MNIYSTKRAYFNGLKICSAIACGRRLVALRLVTCVVADPVTANGVSSSWFLVPSSRLETRIQELGTGVFEREALAGRAAYVQRWMGEADRALMAVTRRIPLRRRDLTVDPINPPNAAPAKAA